MYKEIEKNWFLFIDDESVACCQFLKTKGLKVKQTLVKKEYAPYMARIIRVPGRKEKVFKGSMDTLDRRMLATYGQQYKKNSLLIFSELGLV